MKVVENLSRKAYGETLKEARSVPEHFSKKIFSFKSVVKIEFSYVFTINMFSTAESCMEQ